MFVGFVLVNAPAEHVLPLIQDDMPVEFREIKGSIRQGSATSYYRGTRLVRLEWSTRGISPAACAKIDFLFEWEGMNLAADARVCPDGRVSLGNLRGGGGIASLARVMRLPPGEVTGELHLEEGKLVATRSEVSEVAGRLIWSNAGIASLDTGIGQVGMTLQSEQGRVLGRFSTPDGNPFEVIGRVAIDWDGAFDLDIVVDAGGNPAVEAALLSMGGRRSGRGRVLVKRHGVL